MEREPKGFIFIRAVFMAVFYLFMGICVSTVAASVSMQMYLDHSMLWTALAALFTIPFCLLLMKREGYLETEQSLKNCSAGEIFALILLSISSCIALNYWITISGLTKVFHGFDKVAETIYQGNLAEEFLAVVLVAPLVEELIFRGLAYRGFCRLWRKRNAMLASALFFGIYHRNVVQGVYAFLIGLLLVYVYETYKTLWASIFFHMAANAASVLMTECLDMSFLEKSIGVYLAFTIFFTVLGVFSFLYLYRHRSSEFNKKLTK